MLGPLDAVAALVRPAADRVQVAGFHIGWYAVRHLPERTAYLAFETLADLLVRRGGKGVQRLRSNYARVRPALTEGELDQLVREGMRSYMRYFCEAFRLNDVTSEQLADIVRTSGDGPVRELLAQGRSVVVFIAHMGNWDLAGAWSTQHLAPVTTVAERLEPEEVFQGFLDFRQALGMTILPLTGGPDPFVGLKAAADRGDFIALVADRDLTKNGVEVDFCGQRARMAKGPAVLSILTGAPLFAAAIYYTPAEAGHGIGGQHVMVEFSPQIVRPEGVPTALAAESMVADCAAHLEAAIRKHPSDWHMLQRVFAEDLDPDPAGSDGSEGSEGSDGVKVGIVCPYSFDMPGGVQYHVRDLAEALLDRGYAVSVLAPADDSTHVPDYVVPAGRAVPVRYNGSVARLSFGPITNAKVNGWLDRGRFDLLHLHEPITPSLSMLALWAAECPIVATFHTSNLRSRVMQASYPVLRPSLEKILGRIAVSEDARRTVTTHFGGDAVVIPNGVYVDRFASAAVRPEWAGLDDRPSVAFLGRMEEPRKGMPVLSAALPSVLAQVPGLRVLVAGPGDPGEVRSHMSRGAARACEFLGAVDETDKARLLRSVDVYLAPNTGGESFGIILIEAMSAGAAVLASDIPAFVRVLDGGAAGATFRNGDPDDLTEQLVRLLRDPQQRGRTAAAGRQRAQRFDWAVVADEVIAVYDTVIEGADAARAAYASSRWGRLLRGGGRGS